MEDTYPSDNFKSNTIVVKKDALFDNSHLLIGKNHKKFIDKIILSKGMIIDRIEALANNIVRDFPDKKVILLCVMKGAIQFNTVLSEKITNILKNDCTNSLSMNFICEYISISSYSGDRSTGKVDIKEDESILEKIRGQNVIIVEDIYDSGLTMTALINFLKKFEPNLVKTAVLFQKMNMKNLQFELSIDYLGFLIPSNFVIGFGLDYNEEFRNLDHLCSINQCGIDTFKINKN